MLWKERNREWTLTDTDRLLDKLHRRSLLTLSTDGNFIELHDLVRELIVSQNPLPISELHASLLDGYRALDPEIVAPDGYFYTFADHHLAAVAAEYRTWYLDIKWKPAWMDKFIQSLGDVNKPGLGGWLAPDKYLSLLVQSIQRFPHLDWAAVIRFGLLSNPDDLVRSSALHAIPQLCEKGDRDAITAITALFSDPDADVRTSAVDVTPQLCEKLDQDAITAITPLFSDPDDSVRCWCDISVMRKRRSRCHHSHHGVVL